MVARRAELVAVSLHQLYLFFRRQADRSYIANGCLSIAAQISPGPLHGQLMGLLAERGESLR